MFGVVPGDSILVDLEELGVSDGTREVLGAAGEARSVPLDVVQERLAEAERAVDAEELEAAERMFRRVLCSVARCDAELELKRGIARRCAEQLRAIRPKVGKPPYLRFADLEKSGVVHMYHFEIANSAERNRLVRVVADRSVQHDGLSPEEPGGTEGILTSRHVTRRLQRETAILGMVPKNGPCPCGSGRKYKNCCGAPKARF